MPWEKQTSTYSQVFLLEKRKHCWFVFVLPGAIMLVILTAVYNLKPELIKKK